MHWILWALILAPLSAGSSIAAKIAIIAMTTSSSMSVKPRLDSCRSIATKDYPCCEAVASQSPPAPQAPPHEWTYDRNGRLTRRVCAPRQNGGDCQGWNKVLAGLTR